MGRQAALDKWLVYAIGETPDSLPKPVFEYLRLVGRFWLLGMVNRVMEPGCKFDYCPVLEGPGGLGKSTLVEALAGPEYFSDTHFDVSRGKEGQEQVQGLWMYEIAELAGFGKAEIQLIKAFISAKVDRYRQSYGRVVESFPRQCVLVGTTNERTYLRDRTGNRRFWPIPVRHRINIPWVRKWRDQLLAEAFVLSGEGAEFTPDAGRGAAVRADAGVAPGGDGGAVRAAARADRPPGARASAHGGQRAHRLRDDEPAHPGAGRRRRQEHAALEGRSAAGWSTRAGSVKKQINGARPGATPAAQLAAAGRACAGRNQGAASGEACHRGRR
jgi:hypothetical protein